MSSDTKAEEKSADGAATEEKPADGAASEEKPADGAATEEKPADGSATEEKPADGSTTEETPADEKPADGATEEKKEDDTSAVDAVVDRLKFFFGDANIRQDLFLRKLLTNDEKVVPIETLLKFNTIKQHTTDPEVMIKAAKSEKLANLIKLTEDLKGIKKVDEFTMDKMNANIPVSLVVENLPVKHENNKHFYAVTVEEISSLFEQYGEVALVKLRYGVDADNSKRRGQRLPNGTALVEFQDEAALKAAADDVLTRKDGVVCEPKRKLELGGQQLTTVLLKEFLDDMKKARSKDERESKSGDKKEETESDSKENGKDQGFKMDWKPGCVIKLKELGGSCDREALLDAVTKCLGKSLDEVKEMKIYVDYSRGQTEGAIRFQEPDGAVAEVLEKMKAGDVEVAGQKVPSVALLEGEDEKKYWDDFFAFKSKQKRQRDESKGHHKGYHKGGFRHKRRRN